MFDALQFGIVKSNGFDSLSASLVHILVPPFANTYVFYVHLHYLSRKICPSRDPRIILTGYITGEPLNQVFSHARMFVLPSYHEGLPIVLLEAMSYGLAVLVSDIPANKEVELPDERYFKCGDVGDLKEKLSILERDLSPSERENIRKQVEEKYNWGKIANQTICLS